jgi:hypothetical protein
MELELMMLSKVRQVLKDDGCMFSLINGIDPKGRGILKLREKPTEYLMVMKLA